MDAKWIILDSPGFDTLIEFIKDTKKTSDAAASDVSGLQTDIQGLASRTTNTFKQVDTALGTMDNAKLDKTNAVRFTISVAGWKTDDAVEDYPCYFDLAVSGVTAKDRATVTIAPSGLAAATACGMCPTNETLAGKIRIRSATIPAENILAEYWLDKGKE